MTSDLHVNLLDTIHKNAQNYESFQNITKTHEHIQALITDVLGGVVAAAFEKTRIDFLGNYSMSIV